MKRFSICTLVVVMLVSILPVQAQGDNDRVARIEAALTDDGFNGAVLIAQDGEVLLSKGYGMANYEWSIPNTPQTKFRIGNLTMQFTGMAILLLQERGSLTVEDPICQYLTNCPEAWQEITIHHLLTNTSGIPDHANLHAFRTDLMSPRRPLQIIRLINEKPLSFEPGDRWEYNHSDFIILGTILEEVSGQSYNAFLQQNFFEPLGMVDTGYEADPQRPIVRLANGYRMLGRKAPYVDMSNLFSASGLYSTVEDLHLWTTALHNAQVVSQESWDAMLDAAVPAFSTGSTGYGINIHQVSGWLEVAHDGGISTPGFASYLSYLPEEDVTIIVLSNFEGETDVAMYPYAALFGRILLDED